MSYKLIGFIAVFGPVSAVVLITYLAFWVRSDSFREHMQSLERKAGGYAGATVVFAGVTAIGVMASLYSNGLSHPLENIVLSICFTLIIIFVVGMATLNYKYSNRVNAERDQLLRSAQKDRYVIRTTALTGPKTAIKPINL